MNNSIGKWSKTDGRWGDARYKFIKHGQTKASLVIAKASAIVAWFIYADNCHSTDEWGHHEGSNVDKAARAAWEHAQRIGVIPKHSDFQPIEEP